MGRWRPGHLAPAGPPVTAASAVRCACCCTLRPAAEVFERVPGLDKWFCRDTAGCRKRMASLGDPVGEIAAAPPPSVAGAACSICGTVDPPGGVYERTLNMHACLDRAGCAERSVQSQFLTAHREDFPEVATTKMTTRLHEDRAAGAPAVSDGGTPDPEVIQQAYRDMEASARPRRPEIDVAAWLEARG